MTIQNLFQIRLDAYARGSIDDYFQRFVAHKSPLNVFTFTGVDYFGDISSPDYVGSANISGEVASIIRMDPGADGRYVNGIVYLFAFTDGSIVRVLGTVHESAS
jgi:hypothetical protein